MENKRRVGGSSGLVVMGEDLSMFKRLWVRIPAAYTISHWFAVKMYLLFEKTENKQMRLRMAHFLKQNY